MAILEQGRSLYGHHAVVLEFDERGSVWNVSMNYYGNVIFQEHRSLISAMENWSLVRFGGDEVGDWIRSHRVLEVA